MELAHSNVITDKQIANGEKERPIGWAYSVTLYAWFHPVYYIKQLRKRNGNGS